MTAYTDLKTKTARIDYIREMVGWNDKWALHALVRIYANQTADEQVKSHI